MRKTGLVAGVLAIVASCAVAFAYTEEQVTNGGTITGTVKLEGTAPAPKKVEVTKDKEICGRKQHFDESLIVGSDNGIQYAVVSLPDIQKGVAFKPIDARFDQKGCDYLPHVLAFPAGSTVHIMNNDGILHNIHTYSSKNPPINKAQPKFKKEITVTEKQPEKVRVSCDAHGWMHANWFVASNPYYAVTDDKGGYTIKDVPPGDYTVEVWQEKLGSETQKISVKPGQTTTVNFALKMK